MRGLISIKFKMFLQLKAVEQLCTSKAGEQRLAECTHIMSATLNAKMYFIHFYLLK